MKLRFRSNSLRLRVNQNEVRALAAGSALTEELRFVGSSLTYILIPTETKNSADFDGKAIQVSAALRNWAQSDEIGFYFEVEPGLKVAIERDLECVDGPDEEKDPDAFPRREKVTC